MKIYPFFTFFLIANSQIFSQTQNFNGVVIDKDNGKPLVGVNIIVRDFGTSSNEFGEFSLEAEKNSTALFKYVGFDSVELKLDKNMSVFLNRKPIAFNEIDVVATRAIDKVSPVSFSNLTSDEIKMRYSAEDVPMILSSEPGVWAYSESGNGTGYSYVTIRGFDQSRIAVFFDGVPLNDNESHQVYWVDHGDLLSDVDNIQIQRGIGNNLYGSSAFGGSINVNTKIASDEREISGTIGSGDWNTQKIRASYRSGSDLGDDLSLAVRLSDIKSDGYRQFHDSYQRGFSLGLEHRGKAINQFRALIGYENTDLLWDGIYFNDIEDRQKRRAGYKSYTDDFLQQIYSLNTAYSISDKLKIRNTSYLVLGEGYYETEKTGQSYYNYNLDIENNYTDTQEQNLLTDLLRRKWIKNNYYGFVPSVSWANNSLKIDIGGELRFYEGDHFGEVSNFSNSSLAQNIKSWHRYYQYIGTKNITTSFANFIWHPENQPFTLLANIQNQSIKWNLDQNKIGRAVGYQLDADWSFTNPRFGMLWEIGDSLNAFINWGTSQKEPADNQIIEADDMFSQPVMAAAEKITDLELGLDFELSKGRIRLNGYRIQFLNEQLKNIDIEQEGEYDYYTADSTEHTGFEWEAYYIFNPKVSFSANGAYMLNLFSNGNFLPNIPLTLFNFSSTYNYSNNLKLFAQLKRTGRMYVDQDNTEAGAIKANTLLNLAASYQFNDLELMLKMDNVFDTLYSTYGYGYEYNGYQAYFWPGATRYTYLSLTYSLK